MSRDDDPAERIRLEGADPTNWAKLGLRKLVRSYVTAIARLPDGFILALPDPEYPVPRPEHPAFARLAAGRPVAAFRADAAGRVALVALADAAFEKRVAAVLDGVARLDALGLAERERGRDSLVAFAMNAYDEFGLNCSFAPLA